jgi:hypothetical protein
MTDGPINGNGGKIMVRKVLGIGLVVLLVGALIGGGAYLLLQDSGNGGGGGRGGQGQAAVGGSGPRGSRANGRTEELAIVERGGGYRGGNAAGSGGGTVTPAVAPEEWLTASGVVIAMEEDLVVRTPDGSEVAFSLGPSWYRESNGVTIAVGDEVQVTGFYEDGELMAGTVQNLSAGQVLALRDEGGRPLWSGLGRRGQ